MAGDLPPKLVGTPVKRREDPRLITGGSTYVDDVQLVGVYYAAILRSPHAHARIRRIDVRKASTCPGVALVVTGEDVRSVELPCLADVPGMKRPPHVPLAISKVRHVGDPIAMVVARDRYTARDALDLIEVEYEALPAVSDPEKALEPGAPLLYEEFGDNLAYVHRVSAGDVEQALAEAAIVIRQRFINQRLIPMALESRGTVAKYEPGIGQLTVWLSTQAPHLVRTFLAGLLGLPETQIRVIAPEVGGGFGAKIDFYADEFLVAWAAMRLGGSVKFIEDRRENFLQTIHGRGQVNYVEAGARRDGTVTGLRLTVISDLGAYFQLLTPAIATLTAAMAIGCYRFKNLAVEVRGSFTNATPTGSYRGAGRPEATYVLERTMDLIAGELKLDPVEVRRRNFISPESFPYAGPTGLTYDTGDYEKPLTKLLDLIDYRRFREEQARLHAQGRFVGVGISTYVEICGFGPSSMLPWGGWESATVRVEPTGTVKVLTGSSPHGQGGETSFSQIVADTLRVPIEDIVVVHGDTERVQYGLGTYGSRTIAVGGSAVYQAVHKVRKKAVRIAAHMLEAAPDDIELTNGRLQVKGAPGRGVTFKEVARKAYIPVGMPREIEPGLEEQSFYEPVSCTYPFGAHAAIVEVDAETGRVRVLRYAAVDDVGRVINPMLVDGQVHGGVAQGIGQALSEEVVYDEAGQLITDTLINYTLPRAEDFPMFETATTETLTPVNPLGAKGVGEAGTIASTPAVVNAVMDALKPFGIRHLDMPLKPDRVWAAIRSARAETKKQN